MKQSDAAESIMKQMKAQTTERETISASHISEDGLVSRMCVCVHAKSLQSCPTLCCPMDCGPPGTSVHGILQARILERIAMPSSSRASGPRGRTCISHVSCIGRRVLHHQRHLGSPSGIHESESRSVVSDSATHGLILQARILEGVAFPFSRGSSQPRDRTQVSRIAGRFFTTNTTWEAHPENINNSYKSIRKSQLQ